MSGGGGCESRLIVANGEADFRGGSAAVLASFPWLR